MENAITKSGNYLPATLEELNTFILIGKQKLIAQKAKIKAIEQANLAVEAKEAALSDAQDMAEILLDAEVRLGEILENLPSPHGSKIGNRGIEKNLPTDISHKQSHQAQTLSRNKNVVEQAKAEARENGEIATATRVYHLIKDTPKANRNEDSDALFHLKRWWKKTTKKDRRVFIEWTKEEGL
jgi:hypothetical protein